MPLLTIVEHYLFAALNMAVVETDDDGTLGAFIPICPGVVAFGADAHECALNLYRELEEWVRVSLEKGYDLPEIADINLNHDAARILTTYHFEPRMQSSRYLGEAELDAAFAEHGEIA